MVGFPNKPMGFPTKNDDFGVFWGYHRLRKHPYGNFGCVFFFFSRDHFAKQVSQDFFFLRTKNLRLFGIPDRLIHPRLAVILHSCLLSRP